MTFTVALLTSYTYVYIHVSHVYKLACTFHRTLNLLPLVHVCPVLRHPTLRTWPEGQVLVASNEVKCVRCGSTGQKEDEGCCIERATQSDYIHKQDE
jgi:hypothetical protein